MLKIEPADRRRQRKPGEKIEVIVQWQLEDHADSVEARLVWSTQGKGNTDIKVVAEEQFDNPSLSDNRRISFSLPESPYSFSGKLVSLVWALELIAEPSGESDRFELTMSPSGEEIELHSSEDDFLRE